MQRIFYSTTHSQTLNVSIRLLAQHLQFHFRVIVIEWTRTLHSNSTWQLIAPTRSAILHVFFFLSLSLFDRNHFRCIFIHFKWCRVYAFSVNQIFNFTRTIIFSWVICSLSVQFLFDSLLFRCKLKAKKKKNLFVWKFDSSEIVSVIHCTMALVYQTKLHFKTMNYCQSSKFPAKCK